MPRIQIGLSKIRDKRTQKERLYKYSDVPFDGGGWINVGKYYPIPFDLLYFGLEDNEKIKTGWWTGQGWEGLRLKHEDKISKWKRNQEYD